MPDDLPPDSPWTRYEASFELLPLPDPDQVPGPGPGAPQRLHYRRYEQDDSGAWVLADVVIRGAAPDADQ